MVILLMVLLCASSSLVQGKIDVTGDLSAASPAQIRMAIENRYDDTGPGAKGPEKAHKMYLNLDEALVAYLNDPDTKLSDGDKMRAFRAFTNTDLKHPNQHIPDEKGAYKLVSFTPNKYILEKPILLQSEAQSLTQSWPSLENKWQNQIPRYNEKLIQQYQDPDVYRPLETNYAAVPIRDHSKQNVEIYKGKPWYEHEPLLDSAYLPESPRSAAVVPLPLRSAGRVAYRPDRQPTFARFPYTRQPSFFDLDKTIVKAEKESLFPDTHTQDRHYSYSYGVKEPSTGDFKSARMTHHDDGAISGYYSLREPDGRMRLVQYRADDQGFKATVDRRRHHYVMT